MTKTNVAPKAKAHQAGPTVVTRRRLTVRDLGDSKRFVFMLKI